MTATKEPSERPRPQRRRTKDASGALVRLPPGVSHPIDIHVGERLRQRRTLLGITQEELAATVGLTFQQVQKYERGANRMGASRLYQFSRVLAVPVGYFFSEMDDDLGDPAEGYRRGMHNADKTRPETDEMNRRETLELVRAFYRISDPAKRSALMSMFNALASASDRSGKD